MSGVVRLLGVFIVAAVLQADGAVLEVSTTLTNLDDLVANNEVVILTFYADFCGWCKRLLPELEKAELKLQELDSKVVLAQTQDLALKKRFNISLIPAVWLFVNGRPMYRHWAWEYDDVFDFAHSFDTMSQPVGFAFRNYIWLRSLYRLGIKKAAKRLNITAEHPLHPLQTNARYMLAPLLVFALLLVLVIAAKLFGCWWRRNRVKVKVPQKTA
eukprot:g8957.t1